MLRIFLAVLSLMPAWASATTYVGYLIPNRYEEPTYLTLNLNMKGGKIIGNGSALIGQPVEISITGGSLNEGVCKISLEIRNYSRVTLNGLCSPEKVEGEFRMQIETEEVNRQEVGRFSLQREAGGKSAPVEAAPSGKPRPSRTDCLKKNIACLSFCPRGDYNTEFLCVNHCRRKDAACKGKGHAGAAPISPPPARTPTEENPFGGSGSEPGAKPEGEVR